MQIVQPKPSAKSFGLKPSATEAEAEGQKASAFGRPLVHNVTHNFIRLKGKASPRGFLSLQVYPLSLPLRGLDNIRAADTF